MERLQNISTLHSRFIISADANTELGSGHALRLFPIAEELARMGYEIYFVGNISEMPWIESLYTGIGVKAILTREAYFPNPEQDILIFDSYNFEVENHFLIPNRWKAIIAIVDNNTPKYFSHISVNVFPFSNWIPPNTERNMRILAGPEYVLIRRSLKEAKMRSRPPSDSNLKIIIQGGGVDKYGFTKEVTRFLEKSKLDFEVTVFGNGIETKGTDSRFNSQPIGMGYDRHVANADLFFTTAGASCWELLTYGGVIGIAAAVDNQRDNYRNIVNFELGVGIGIRDKSTGWKLDPLMIENLITDTNLRIKLYENSKKLFDGNGVERIINSILQS